jgi:fructose-1,6-bisphosphatase I
MQDSSYYLGETKIMTIQRYIAQSERHHPEATGAFSTLLRSIALAAKVVSREVRRAGLVDILGQASITNVSGDEVKKLDIFANRMVINSLEHAGQLCAMASEEDESIIPVPPEFHAGKYVMLFDPLDGSSNIDANVTIGTIFSIVKRITESGQGTEEDVLQPGYKQVAAGYVMYGASTIMVISTGEGVQGFTLDPTIGEFLLSHKDIRIPQRGKIYSINEGNKVHWSDGIRRYIEYLQELDSETNRPYSARYIGSMAGDVHRTLLYGGIFMYPGDKKNPNGKLRLLYEANPMAYIVEQAGGRAIDGSQRILDIIPSSIHQRVPVFLGSTNEIDLLEEFLKNKR